MLHVGTLAAVVAVYYRELWALIKKPFQKRVYMLVLACIVTALFWFLFEDVFTTAFTGKFLGFGFLLTSLILLIMEKLAHGKRSVEKMRVYEALGIGAMQGIAILPGVSRSGSTIAGARFFGLSKAETAQFSFILSIPVILGALLLQLPDAVAAGTGSIPWAAIGVGTLVSAVSGYFAIRWMIKLIVNKSLLGFAVYTLALGSLVLLDQLVTNIFFTSPF